MKLKYLFIIVYIVTRSAYVFATVWQGEAPARMRCQFLIPFSRLLMCVKYTNLRKK